MSDRIKKFPFAILVCIFGHLPLKDRKNTRLVCRNWAEANSGREISSREKLLCTGYSEYELNDVIRVVRYSQRAVLNLDFQYCDFRTDATFDFWLEHGERIEFLWLWHCQFSADAIKHVIVECRNLRYLAMNNIFQYWEPFDDVETFLATFEELRVSGIRRDSVRGLRIGVRPGGMSNYIFHVLLTIYRKIEQFSFYCDDLDEGFGRADVWDEALLMSAQDFTSSAILRKLLDFKLQMTSIELYADNDSPESWRRGERIHDTILGYTFPNLKYFNTTLSFGRDESKYELIYDFIDRHPRLKSMRFVICDGPPDEGIIKRLMNTLLHSCPDLRCLHVEDSRWCIAVNQNAVTDPAIFIQLASSKFESLTLHLNLQIDPMTGRGLTNDSLKSLTFMKGEQYRFDLEPTLSVFLRTFRNLTRLAIMNGKGMDDGSLQSIFKYQTNLTSLELSDSSETRFTDFGFTGIHPDGRRTGYSISQLTKLQSLTLDLQYVDEITSKTISEFKFPNLLYLYISCGNPTGWDVCADLFRVISQCTELEGLFCDLKTDVALEEWVDLCGRMKKLRFLERKEGHKENGWRDIRFPQLFEACPTLRAYQHSNVDRIYSYYYDVLEQRVKTKIGPNTMELALPDGVPRNRLASEWIDTYWVDWLVLGAPQARYTWSSLRE